MFFLAVSSVKFNGDCFWYFIIVPTLFSLAKTTSGSTTAPAPAPGEEATVPGGSGGGVGIAPEVRCPRIVEPMLIVESSH